MLGDVNFSPLLTPWLNLPQMGEEMLNGKIDIEKLGDMATDTVWVFLIRNHSKQ